MALSEIKINIQKQETKDEPQTNCSYKIRQIVFKIIFKIMEYTHIHIYPWAKSKQTNKNKAKCKLGNKAMKTKLTNILREKERKKTKKE